MAYSFQTAVTLNERVGTFPAAFCNNPFMGIPSVFPCFLFSFWVSQSRFDHVGLVDLDRHDLGLGGVAISAAPGGITLECFDASVNPIIEAVDFAPPTWPPSTGGAFFNLLISVNTTTQTAQVYVNDVAVTFSQTWLSSNQVGNTKPDWALYGSSSTCCWGDMWFSNQSEFTDLSITANRRKFINADLTPVDLGSNGQIPFGSSPPLFMHLAAGDTDIADFLANAGSGGSFSVSTDGFSIVEINGCGPFPMVAPVPPTGTCGAATTTSVTFTWDPDPANPDPDSYTLQYGPHGSDPATWTTVTGLTGTSYTLSPVAINSSWDWQIEAIYSGTPTGFSTTYTCPTTATPYAAQFLSCDNGFTITAPITKMWGFDHLIGMSVVGLLDGILMAPTVVAADGSVTLPFAASNVKIGLPFTPQLQTPYLDAGQPTVQGRRKNISAVTARIEASLGVLAGANQPDGAAQQPPAIATTWGPMTPAQVQPVPSAVPVSPTYQSPAGQTVTKLVTGDMRTVVTADWQIPGQVAIQGTPGLPLNVLDCVPELLEGDTTEQTYAQREPRELRGGPGQPAARGPGMWMLRR